MAGSGRAEGMAPAGRREGGEPSVSAPATPPTAATAATGTSGVSIGLGRPLRLRARTERRRY